MAHSEKSLSFDKLVDSIVPAISDHPNTNFDLSLASWMGSSILKEYQVRCYKVLPCLTREYCKLQLILNYAFFGVMFISEMEIVV